MFSSSSGPALTENARRPDAGGTLGSKVEVRANFFAIKKLQVDTIWHYDVSITPEIEDKTKIRRLWKVIERIPELAENKVVFDGKCNAYAAQELGFVKLTHKIDLPDVDASQSTPQLLKGAIGPANTASGTPKSGPGAAKFGPGTGKPGPGTAQSVPGRDQRRNEFTVKFSRVATIELEELHRFLRREGPITPSCYQAIQAFNIVLTHKLSGKMESHGRSVFHSGGAEDLGGGIQRWNGAFQSVRAGQDKLFANIDIANTAFFKGGKVEDLMVELKRNARGPADLSRLNLVDFKKFHKHFKGLPFTVSHRGPDFKRRIKKVSEISMKRAQDITFDQELNDGSKKAVTIPQYYDAAYSLKLRYPFLPCVGVKGKDGKMIYFPAEICEIVPGRRYKKKLDPDQTSRMIKGTTLRPADRARRIEQLFPLLDHERDEYMKSFKLEVSKDMEVVPARILPAPPIEFRGRYEEPSQGSWKLGKFHKGATLSSYGILVFESEANLAEARVRNFVRILSQTLAEKGMPVPMTAPPIMYGQVGNVECSVDAMRSLIVRHCGGGPPQLILVILPGEGGMYPDLKAYCETTGAGIMTQCMRSDKATQEDYKLKQYCIMLGLKINVKLGGCNSVLKNGVKFLTEQPTIIFGADVTHPAPGENRQSIVAVVASMDVVGFQFSGRIKVQEGGQEVIDGLRDLVHELLLAFQRQVRKLPARILFYRDGVSEGQYADILDKEFKAVKEACRQIDEKYDPPTTFCVVKKRHHARFFPMVRNNPEQQQQAGSTQQNRPAFQQGRPPFQQGRPPFQQGRPPFQQGQGRPPFQQGRPPFQQGRPPFQQGRPPFQQGRPPFQQNDPNVDRSGNCVAGTIIDTVITHPTEFDFYLQSHAGIQGTSRPTLYHILLDENKFSSDGFQELTYQLCHTYSRCPKAVSIVPAVYYAHLLAYRARHYQGNEFSDTASSASGGYGPTFQTSSGILNNMYFV